MVLGLSYLDIVVLVLYFAIIVYIGIRSSLKIKKEEDYFLGGRKFGKLFSTFASFGQATSADGPAGVATTTFKNGASGIWSSLLMLFATPLFWITAPWLRRLRITTMGDFYEQRYVSRKMAATYALVGTIGMMGLLSVGYKAVTTTAMAMTGKPDSALTATEKIEKEKADRLFELSNENFTYLSQAEKQELTELRQENPRALFSYFSEDMLIWTICFIVLFYTAMGGLEAAFYTDLLQGIFIILLSIILIPFAWSAINEQFGGSGMMDALSNLHEQLPESTFEIFGSPATLDFTWYFIVMAALVSGMTVVAQPNQLVTAGAAKSEDAARTGFVTGTFMKRIVTILWGMVGLCAILLYGGKIMNSDFVWGHATTQLLAPLGLGLVGLMLASLMAALMSTADCLMITVSGLVVNNFYKYFFPNHSARHYIWAARISGAIFLIGAAIITTQFDTILQILKFIWEFFVVFVAAFWLGLKWRRANRISAWSSILLTFALFYLIPTLLPNVFPAMRSDESLTKLTDSRIVTRNYEVKEVDLENRIHDIAQWEKLPLSEKEQINKPEELSIGGTNAVDYAMPRQAIFWSKGVTTDKDGTSYGRGYIYLELYLLDRLGWDLSKNPYALNETIRLGIRLLFPFLVLILIALATKPDSEEHLRLFYQKMRTRAVDNSSLKNQPITETLLFPNSNWELYTWNKKDRTGFLLACLIVILIIGLLYLMVSLGS